MTKQARFFEFLSKEACYIPVEEHSMGGRKAQTISVATANVCGDET